MRSRVVTMSSTAAVAGLRRAAGARAGFGSSAAAAVIEAGSRSCPHRLSVMPLSRPRRAGRARRHAEAMP